MGKLERLAIAAYITSIFALSYLHGAIMRKSKNNKKLKKCRHCGKHTALCIGRNDGKRFIYKCTHCLKEEP